MSLKGTFGGRVDPQFRRGTASSERLAVAVAANPVAIGVQAVRIAVAVVNRDSVANIGAVKVRWRRRQAVIRVSRVATLLRGWRRSLSADFSVHRLAGDAIAIGVHVCRLPVVLVVGTCLLEGPPRRLHRRAILPNYQLDRSGVAGRVVVGASVIVVAAAVAGATVGKGCACC
jgi:hypothetical protein